MHSEANAIIAASREQMLGATLYMACLDSKTGELVPDTNSCAMCKKMIINAGIDSVVIRNTPSDYKVIKVSEWIDDDDSLTGRRGY